MKAAGFRKDHDFDIIKADFIDNNDGDNLVEINEIEKEKVIKYLEKGERIFSITLFLFDNNAAIGPYYISTDGKWFWPSHLIYYLNKNSIISLPNEFIKYIQERNYEIISITNEERKKAVGFLEKEVLNY